MTNCVGAVIDKMVKRGTGHIVNMSSDSGKRVFMTYFNQAYSQTCLMWPLNGT